VAPRESGTDGNGATLDEAVLGQLPAHHEGQSCTQVAFLYVDRGNRQAQRDVTFERR